MEKTTEKLSLLGYSKKKIQELFDKYQVLDIKSLEWLLENDKNTTLRNIFIFFYEQDIDEDIIKLAVCDLDIVTQYTVLSWIKEHQNDFHIFFERYYEKSPELILNSIESELQSDINFEILALKYRYPLKILKNIGFDHKESLEELSNKKGNIEASLDALISRKIPEKIQYLLDLNYSITIIKKSLIEADQDVMKAIDYIEGYKLKEKKRKNCLKEDYWEYNPEIFPRIEPKETIMSLGNDQIHTILSFLELQDNLNVSLTCKTLSKVSRSNLIWMKYVPNDFYGENEEQYYFRDDIEDLRESFIKVKSEEIKMRRNFHYYEQKVAEYELENETSHYRKVIWRIYLLISFILYNTTILLYPLIIEFGFNYGYMWMIAYAPFFIIGITFLLVVSVEIKSIINQYYLLRFQWLIGSNSYKSNQRNDAFYLYPFHSIPILFLITGIFLFISQLKNISYWRFYYIPWLIYLFILIIIQLYHSYRVSRFHRFYEIVLIAFISLLTYLSLIITIVFITCKLDKVSYFDEMPWTLTFIPLNIFFFIFPCYISIIITRLLGVYNWTSFLSFLSFSFYFLYSNVLVVLVGLKLDGRIKVNYLWLFQPLYFFPFILISVFAFCYTTVFKTCGEEIHRIFISTTKILLCPFRCFFELN